jgi:phage terminase large subunit
MARKVRQYRRDPVSFVREVIGVEPTPHQAALLNSLVTHARTSIRSGHGTGKTSGLAMAHWWFICCFKNARIPCTAPTSHQLEDLLWAEITKWGARMEPWFRNQFEIKSDKVVNKRHPKTWYSVARTARREQPDALQGFHEDYLLFIIDEASGVHDDIFKPIKGALTGKFNRLVMAGNPVRNSGYFFVSPPQGPGPVELFAVQQRGFAPGGPLLYRGDARRTRPGLG